MGAPIRPVRRIHDMEGLRFGSTQCVVDALGKFACSVVHSLSRYCFNSPPRAVDHRKAWRRLCSSPVRLCVPLPSLSHKDAHTLCVAELVSRRLPRCYTYVVCVCGNI